MALYVSGSRKISSKRDTISLYPNLSKKQKKALAENGLSIMRESILKNVYHGRIKYGTGMEKDPVTGRWHYVNTGTLYHALSYKITETGYILYFDVNYLKRHQDPSKYVHSYKTPIKGMPNSRLLEQTPRVINYGTQNPLLDPWKKWQEGTHYWEEGLRNINKAQAQYKVKLRVTFKVK